MQRGNRRCNRWEEFRWRPRSKGRSRPGFLALKWMSGLEASWASRAFNGLEFCSFGRFRSPIVLSGVVVWSCLFERPLWPAKECLLEAWFKQSWLFRFFTLASTGLWSLCHLLADVWTGCYIWPCMAFILGALPCLRQRHLLLPLLMPWMLCLHSQRMWWVMMCHLDRKHRKKHLILCCRHWARKWATRVSSCWWCRKASSAMLKKPYTMRKSSPVQERAPHGQYYRCFVDHSDP